MSISPSSHTDLASQNLIDDLNENPSPRCPCMIVLDTSSLNNDTTTINNLNAALQNFLDAIKKDEVAACSIELGVISTAGVGTLELPLTSALHLEQIGPIFSNGKVSLGQATERALQHLEQRKDKYRKNGVAYYQPWLVIISDGASNDAYQHVARQTCNLTEQRKLICLPVGIQNADLKKLSEFSIHSAKTMDGLNFASFFEWLSASMSRVSASTYTSLAGQSSSSCCGCLGFHL